MTAQTKDTPRKERDGKVFVDPVEEAVTIFAGALVCLNAAGNAVPGSTALNLTARGVAKRRADNAAGADGAVSVESEKGVFHFMNDGGDPIDRADIGGTAYIVDDQTVAATDGTGTRSAAGTIEDVDATGVWVRI